jgi:RNA polymerase sigma-70 factor (ECF subfamily)
VALRADDVDIDRDAALVERFQTGDDDAFADLYQRYFGRLRRYCQRRLGDPHDAEEAAQEALIRAYRALPALGGDRRFYPWLRVIAANVCADRCKRKPVAPLAEPEGGDVVVDSVFQMLDREQVRAALHGLNPRHQAALSLWAEGYKSRDIAEQLGCSRGAIDVTLHRARQSFRKRFLALTGDDKLGAVGLVPALGRWAQRWRARVTTRVANHADFVSPLAAKVAAGAIALSVVGGAAATANTATPARPAGTPAPAVQVQTKPASAVSPAPASAPVANATSPSPSAGSASGQPPPAVHPAPPTGSPLPVVMSADEANRQSAQAPIKVSAAGTFVNVDPQPVTDTVKRVAGSGRS